MSTDPKRICVYDPLAELMAHYADASARKPERAALEDLPVEERLKRRIVEGDRIGIERDLEEAMQSRPPLGIVNDVLLEGMKTVGELFGAGEMQLPVVQQSAETMKTAVAWLESFMEKSEGLRKGTMVLATVKGDVHDIGKNLVDIILTNNGYRVINLGIKCPVETMLHASEENRADAIGMSGLLVKSTLVMKENLELMRERGIAIPVVLGGAALTRRFVEEELRPLYGGPLAYANDAFDGLKFMERIASGGTVAAPSAAAGRPSRRGKREEAKDADASRRSAIAPLADPPRPPFLGSKIAGDIPLEKVFSFINEVALIRGQWQVRKGKRSEREYKEQLEKEIHPRLEEWKLRAVRERLLRPAVIYGYFPCASEGNDLILYRPAALEEQRLFEPWPAASYAPAELAEWRRFTFPRQRKDRFLCISDFFLPASAPLRDTIALQIVTVGARAAEFSAELFASNRYQDYLFFHGLSVESAEALAEYWHARVRAELGIAEQDAADTAKLFSQGYRGSRYSFGYPACPNLEDQAGLFALLRPERIGISLTEEFHLVPEQSTSALIVHHPSAKYFIA